MTAIQQRLFLQQLSLESVNLAVELFLQSPNLLFDAHPGRADSERVEL